MSSSGEKKRKGLRERSSLYDVSDIVESFLRAPDEEETETQEACDDQGTSSPQALPNQDTSPQEKDEVSHEEGEEYEEYENSQYDNEEAVAIPDVDEELDRDCSHEERERRWKRRRNEILQLKVEGCMSSVQQYDPTRNEDEADLITMAFMAKLQPLLDQGVRFALKNIPRNADPDDILEGCQEIVSAMTESVKASMKAQTSGDPHSAGSTTSSAPAVWARQAQWQGATSAHQPIISAVNAGKMPTVSTQTFQTDVAGYAERLRAWMKNSRVPTVERKDIPTDNVARRVCDHVWETGRGKTAFATLNWTDTRVPLETVCDVWTSNTTTTVAKGIAFHETKTKEWKDLLLTRVVFTLDNRAEMHCLSAQYSDLHDKAALEQPNQRFSAKEEREQALRFSTLR